MILQALYEYYQRKAADPGSTIAPHGLEWKEIPYLILIDKKGNFLELHKSRKTKRDGCEKRNAFIETKTKCASNLIRKVTVYLQNQSKTPSLYIKINGIQMDF